MTYTVAFRDAQCSEPALTGGKGANLGRLSARGFAVPPGFVVTTTAYLDFIDSSGLASTIADLARGIDYADVEALDRTSEKIREQITTSAVPEQISGQVLTGYAAFGDSPSVAVRSSGTAEDLEETSFAGQHDTFLDIQGADAVLDAVSRCWASMWTSRALAYRQKNGIDHSTIGIAVVVQRMVESEISGVLFTANPISGATGEMVVNASWGLGEAIVGGIVTPDEYVLSADTLETLDSTVARKTVRVVRAPSGQGTVVEEIPPADQERGTLSPAQLVELGTLGRRVQEYYDDLPQDIEWAYADGEFQLLQSREVTGATLSWDSDLDDFAAVGRADRDTVWTREWANSVFPGAVTPLFYSIRHEMGSRMHRKLETLWGFDDVAEMRVLKYHRGRIYYNSRIDYRNIARSLPPSMRAPELLVNVPASWRTAIGNEPWSWSTLPKLFARIKLLSPDNGPYSCWRHIYEQLENRTAEADGQPVEKIRAMSDRELTRYLDSRIQAMSDWVGDLWTPFYLYTPMAMSTLMTMLKNWYTGTNPWILNDLITGLDTPTITLTENLELWELAVLVRDDAELRALFDEHPGRAFFDEVGRHPAGAAFAEAYATFIGKHGHRGHPDRDMYGSRRIEDPGVDYGTIRSLITARTLPDAAGDLVERRRRATEEVIASIRSQPLASLKVEAFTIVHSWLLRFFQMRDDERHFSDRITFSKKRAITEVGRRLVERGVLDGDDFYFLSKNELLALLDGRGNRRLARRKITARRRNWETVRAGADRPSGYLVGDTPTELDAPPVTDGGGDVLRGAPTSRGDAVGIARVVTDQRELGRVQQGDILIASATDPGWTPVFLVISGLVLETGGMLAHGSCISREYGIPAVVVPGALHTIPDGSTISVNGDTGEVRILEMATR